MDRDQRRKKKNPDQADRQQSRAADSEAEDAETRTQLHQLPSRLVLNG